MKTTFYYNANNGGDGSVSLRWYDSKELAEWVDENQDVGWGESSVGEISIESAGDVKFSKTLQTVDVVFLDMILHNSYENKKYVERKNKTIQEFLSKFKITNDFIFKSRSANYEDYSYVDIYKGDKLVHSHFCELQSNTIKNMQDLINSYLSPSSKLISEWP